MGYRPMRMTKYTKMYSVMKKQAADRPIILVDGSPAYIRSKGLIFPSLKNRMVFHNYLFHKRLQLC